MERLVAVGFNINKRNKENYTALHFGKLHFLYRVYINIYHIIQGEQKLGLSMFCFDVTKCDKKNSNNFLERCCETILF